jgi:hypothetical protein
MKDVIENKDGLYDLLGIPKTYVLIAREGDIILVKVPGNDKTEQEALARKINKLLPNNQVLVLQEDISVNVLPISYVPGIMFAETE